MAANSWSHCSSITIAALGGLAVATEHCREAARAGRLQIEPGQVSEFFTQGYTVFSPRQQNDVTAGHSKSATELPCLGAAPIAEGGGMIRLSKAIA